MSLVEDYECARARKDLARLDYYAARIFSRERREAGRRWRQASRELERLKNAMDRENAEEVLRELDCDNEGKG